MKAAVYALHRLGVLRAMAARPAVLTMRWVRTLLCRYAVAAASSFQQLPSPGVPVS